MNFNKEQSCRINLECLKGKVGSSVTSASRQPKSLWSHCVGKLQTNNTVFLIVKHSHLYCWKCLFQWLEKATQSTCPVCKAGVTKESVVPLYGRGKEQQRDPRAKDDVPQRPTGTRMEPPPPRRVMSAIFSFFVNLRC